MLIQTRQPLLTQRSKAQDLSTLLPPSRLIAVNQIQGAFATMVRNRWVGP